jgi:hypothetical protein
MVPYVPRPQRGPSVKAGQFRKDEVQYDATRRQLCMSSGLASSPLFIVIAAWAEEDQLRQQASMR